MRDRLRRISPGLLIPLVFAGTLIVLVGAAAGLGMVGDRQPQAPSASSSAEGSSRPSTPAPTTAPTPTPSSTPTPEVTATLVGAGDIATCGGDGDEATAKLIESIPGTVFAAGDNAYNVGSIDEYHDCYLPSWGRFLDRTLPAAGNHDWGTDDLAGYHQQFGARAGQSGQSWYSAGVGAWHVIVLDSNCDSVGGCDPASPQGIWLAADLAASNARCTVAIFHHPRFSSGFHGNDKDVDPFWRALHAAGVDVVLNGHDHDYERFAPQDPDGVATERGIREFVVGTGGAPLRVFETPIANSVVRASIAFGVLKMTLHQASYDWQFITVDGSFTDSGSATCH